MKLYRRANETAQWELSPPEDYIDRQKDGYLYRFFKNDEEAAANLVHPRVDSGTVTKFEIDYYRSGMDKHMRFGQAFINQVLPAWILDPQLFYTRDRAEAERIIKERYTK